MRDARSRELMSKSLLLLAAVLVAPVIDAQEPRLIAVSNEMSRDVTLLDGSTGRVVATIPVGERPRGIHASRDGKRLYVALSDDLPQSETGRDAIGVIDLVRKRTIARLPGGTDPEQFALSPDGKTLYASNEDAGTAVAIDIASRRSLATYI